MDQTRVIEVKKNILAANDEAADAFRAARAQEGTFFVDVMASPGAGKTTLLLALIRELRARGVEALGVIEAEDQGGRRRLRGAEHPRGVPCGDGHGHHGLRGLRRRSLRLPVP